MIKFTYAAGEQKSSKIKLFNKINTVSENSGHDCTSAVSSNIGGCQFFNKRSKQKNCCAAGVSEGGGSCKPFPVGKAS